MRRRLREWISMKVAKQPGTVVLLAILLFNVVFFLLSALIVSSFSVTGTEKMGFLEAAFYTITMILDAGCIQFVLDEVGQVGVSVVLICIGIIIVGMITFTGAVIGYMANYISSFVEKANAGSKKLVISDHVVILNWNTRASEIVNDLLFCEDRQSVVVLASSRKAEIEKEIEERLADTIHRENASLRERCKGYGPIRGTLRYCRQHMRQTVTVVVREGDVFSSKQLHDISLEHAKTVIILGNDINNTVCKFEQRERNEQLYRGNAQTIKTLMQVADITGAESSDDDQKIIVEITDDWTAELVEKIIACKQVDGKCKIVPVNINHVLGQILSQFSLMPELNLAYGELFSNQGMTFYARRQEMEEDDTFIRRHLAQHRRSIPLTFMMNDRKSYAFYAAGSEKDILRRDEEKPSSFGVKLNHNYWIERKNVIILGHNSKRREIMGGFQAFRSEWNYKDGSGEILNLMVIDDEKSLERLDYYRDYPFVTQTVAASIYDKEIICDTIKRFIASNEEDTSILILSDDDALNEDIDANALANLVYVQNIIEEKKLSDPNFDVESVDVIVEIIDPKHHDVVNSYSVNNVVISNRYISKMITQIGEKEALQSFYADILTYDAEGAEVYESKEIYAKKVSRFFEEIPPRCTARELIRAVYEASADERLPASQRNPAIVLGYVKPGGEMVLFQGDQEEIWVELTERDKLIVFSNH